MLGRNTAVFARGRPAAGRANVDGDTVHVRVRVRSNAVTLDRKKQLVGDQVTEIVAAAAAKPALAGGCGSN